MSRSPADGPLAARFRAAFQRERADSSTKRESDKVQELRDRMARIELIQALDAFAREVGVFGIVASERRLILRYQGKALRFECAAGLVDMQVSGPGLEGRWTLRREGPGVEGWALAEEAKGQRGASRPLFHEGLELLMSRCFGVRFGVEDDRHLPMREQKYGT